MPNKNEVNENSDKRGKIIQRGETRLHSATKTAQNELFALIGRFVFTNLEIENGFIVNSTENLAKFAASDQVNKFFEKVANPKFAKVFDSSFSQLDNQSTKFNRTFDVDQFNQKRDIVLRKMQQVNSGFQTKLFDQQTLQKRIRARVLQLIGANVSVADFRAEMRVFLKGDVEKLGIVENFYFVGDENKNRPSDAFAEYDRELNNSYAAQLELNYAIYQGGKINTTRDFCSERNGQVFTREEIQSWNSLDWPGKKQGGNVLIDAGGWNCRHFYDWISFELASQLRPGIPQSQFDVVDV